MSDIDKWIDIAKECKYLPENDLKVIWAENFSERNLLRSSKTKYVSIVEEIREYGPISAALVLG